MAGTIVDVRDALKIVAIGSANSWALLGCDKGCYLSLEL